MDRGALTALEEGRKRMDGFSEKGFLGSVFDFSFSEFITPKVIKVLFILGIGLGALMSLVFVIAAFIGSGAGAGIGALILCPILYLLNVIGLRVYLEIVIVVFRMGENLAALARASGAVPAGSPVSP